MEVSDQQPQLGFRDYFHTLWLRRWMIAAVTILALVGSVVYSKSSAPIYQGTAQLLLTPQVSSAVLQANNTAGNPTTDGVDVPTDSGILESTSVKDAIAKEIPNPPNVTVSQEGTTNIVDVSTQSTNKEIAAKAANDYANFYIKTQEQQAVDALDSASQIVQNQINTLQTRIDSVNASIAAASSKDNTSGLTAQVASLESAQATFRGELENYQFAASLNTGGGKVVSVAAVPTTPVAPKPVEYAVIAGLIGFLVAVGAALLLEFLDERTRSREDLQQVAGSIPILGLIPSIADWRDTHAQYLVSRSSPNSVPAEAYRSLRTSIQFIGLENVVKTVQFTSPNAAEGKTTTLANLAVVMAQSGQRVVTVCCDFRRPRLHEFFNLSNRVGFTSVLLGETTLEEALQPVPGLDGLHILASGQIPPNPSELLSGARTGEVLAQLAEHADVVLIDSPPILPVTDAAVLASRVDAVVMVVAAGISMKSQVARALETLSRVDAPVAGLVLNRAAEADSYAYYQYAYGGTVPTAKPSRNGRAQKVPQAVVSE